MDARIQAILEPMLVNLRVLDGELLRLMRSDLFTADDACFQLIEQVNEACFANLQTVESLRRRLAGNAFVIPPDMMASLE